MKRWGAAVSSIVMVGLLAGCSSGAKSSAPAAETVQLTATTMAFTPKEITVRKGAPVTLVFENKDTLLHDFSIDKMPVTVKESKGDDHGGDHGGSKQALHVAADAGKSGTVEFTPTEAGTYTFYCTVPGHKDSGMVGKLIVQEQSR